jgi:hypothetical protein
MSKLASSKNKCTLPSFQVINQDNHVTNYNLTTFIALYFFKKKKKKKEEKGGVQNKDLPSSLPYFIVSLNAV